MREEIPIADLQRVITRNWTGGVLSNWIDIVKKEYPGAEVINYLGSTSGRINGVLYDFYEKRMFCDSPKIVKSIR